MPQKISRDSRDSPPSNEVALPANDEANLQRQTVINLHAVEKPKPDATL